MLNTKSIGAVGVINALSTVLGLLYSVVLARYFGVGTSIEVYFASTTLLFMINSLTQSGLLAEIALPIYHQYQSNDSQDSANRVMSVVVNWLGILAIVFSLGSFLGAPWLFYWSASGFDAERLEQGVKIFRIISPLLFVEIMKSQISSMVNAEKRFGKIEWVNILNQVTSMVFIVLLAAQFEVYSVVAGLWVGELIALGYGIYVLSKTKFRYHFILKHPGFEVTSVLKKMGFTFIYVLVTQLYLFYLNNLITTLPKGTYAIYRYAMLIFSKIQGLLIRPVSTIFFSQFSSAFHVGSNRLKALVEETASLSFVISAFAFGGLMAAGHPLLRILWEGEKFTGGAIMDVYKTLTIISICLFFNALAIIFRKISMTLGKVKEMYLGYIGVQILSFVALLFLKDIISLELVLSVLLLNTIILAFVPIVLVKRTSSIDVPINLGEKTGRNVVYFLLLSGFGAMLEWSTLHFGIFQNAFVAFGFSVAVFLLLSVLAAFLLGLNELRFLKSIQSKIASRF